jgi:hypothetical protein
VVGNILIRNRVLGNEIVILYVGEQRKQFTVHKKLLCDRCEYFSKAFRGNFQEAGKGEMYLPEDHPAVVASLIDYLYRGALPEATNDDGYSLLVCLFFLAEKLCMTVLIDRVCDAIRFRNIPLKSVPTPQSIKMIYSNSREGSTLRKYCAGIIGCLVIKYSKETHFGDAYNVLHDECTDFFVDVFKWLLEHGKAIGLSTNVNGPELLELFGPCEFHSHGKDEQCHLKTGE